MPTWQFLSLDSLHAARKLLTAKHPRSCISRAYYSAYSAVSGLMVEQGVTFPYGWKNPAHDQLVSWLAKQKKWSINHRRQLLKSIRRLRKGREDADYRPGITFSYGEAVKFIREATFILRSMEIKDEGITQK